jgi:hypothetical protein
VIYRQWLSHTQPFAVTRGAISAMTLLESKLRERLNKPQYLQVRRPMSVSAIVELASPRLKATLERWLKV